MARKNLFEAMERDLEVGREYQKLCRMIAVEDYNFYTLHQQIELFFRYWSRRRNYASFTELRNHLGFRFRVVENGRDLTFDSTVETVDQFLLFCELMMNILNDLQSHFVREHKEHSKHVFNTILANLEIIHHMPHQLDDRSIICIPIDPAALSAAEVVDKSLVDPVLEYHHHLLKGDIEKKKAILTRLHNDLEGRRTEIAAFNADLESDLFFMFNNMNLRHNNTQTGKPSNLSPAFAALSGSQIESYYDEAFQLCLLAFLALNNQTRHQTIAALRQQNKAKGAST